MYAYTNNRPEDKHACEIILIGKTFQGKKYEAHSHFENMTKACFGMYMNADIEIKSDSVYSLPDAAIVRFENSQYVFTKTGDNSFSMHEVATASENGYTEILLGRTMDRPGHCGEGCLYPVDGQKQSRGIGKRKFNSGSRPFPGHTTPCFDGSKYSCPYRSGNPARL